ncbi:MAG: hypothetical protein U5Q44_07545 [Dehalococcoidia bacterium]|nr:hypothetical protein [Dehalococcoidia bacterium]
MVRLSDLDPGFAEHLRELPLPHFEDTPWAEAPRAERCPGSHRVDGRAAPPR